MSPGDIDWRGLLASLELEPEDHDPLERALEEGDLLHGVRAMLTSALRVAIQNTAPERLTSFDRFQARLPRFTFFDFIPLRYFVLQLAHAAHLIWPERAVVDACNDLMVACLQPIHELPLFRPLLIACEGRVADFFRLYPNTHSQVYNCGSASFEQHSLRHVTQHFNGVPSGLARCYSVGYCSALIEAFGSRGEVKFIRHNAQDFSLQMRW